MRKGTYDKFLKESLENKLPYNYKEYEPRTLWDKITWFLEFWIPIIIMFFIMVWFGLGVLREII